MASGFWALAYLALTVPGALPPDVLPFNQREFEIPIRMDPKRRGEVRELTLWYSVDQGKTWLRQTSATPDKPGFAFRATADGLYWFAVSVTDQRGERDPKDAPRGLKVSQKILVDSAKPDLQLSAVRQGEEINVRWDIREENPDTATYKLEYRTADGPGGLWTPAAINPTAGNQTTFRVPGSGPVSVRMVVQDLAQNTASVQQEVPAVVAAAAPVPPAPPPLVANVVAMPELPSAPALPPPTSIAPTMAPPPAPVAPPVMAAAPPTVPPPAPVPVAVQPAPAPALAPTLPTQPAPVAMPREVASAPAPAAPRTAPNDGGWSPAPANGPAPAARQPIAESRTPTPAGRENWVPPQPPLTVGGSSGLQPIIGTSNPQDPGVTTAAHTAGARGARNQLPPLQMINNPRFTLEYEVEKFGPSGIGSAELYFTRTDGKEWQRFDSRQLNVAAPVDPGPGATIKRTMVVDLPEEGPYGFYMIVRSGAGLGAPPPQPGEAPQMRVELDTRRPDVKLFQPQAEPTRRNTLIIAWSAEDRNLLSAPVTIEWAERADGAWHLIGSPEMQNTGRYLWEVPAGTPHKVFLRVSARDTAGNVGVAESLEPLLVDLTQPAVKGLRLQPTPPSR